MTASSGLGGCSKEDFSSSLETEKMYRHILVLSFLTILSVHGKLRYIL